MPADDVSDLRDVFDAINKLCETMKTSNYDDAPPGPEGRDGAASPEEGLAWAAARSPEAEDRSEASVARSQFVSAEDLSVQRMETQRQKWRESQASLASSEAGAAREADDASPAARWSESRVSPPGPGEEAEALACDAAPGEPVSDLYHSASEVSLLSDSELAGRPAEEGSEVVVAGHVAAMRQRFESMTRAGEPAPDPDPR